jgi:Tfp pilus assembly protein PilO
MSVKQFLDENPLAALVAVIVATGTLVAGVTAYFSSELLSSRDAEHKAELLEQSAKHRAELSDVSSSFKQTVADLSSRLTSIERKLPGSGPVYLDVSKITIGPEAVQSLPATYKPFMDKTFYVAIPQGGEPWKFSETTELDIGSTMYGPELFQTEGLAQIMREPKVDLWRGVGELTFYVKCKPLKKNLKLSFFPAVSVEHFSKEQLKKRFSALIDVFSSEKERDKPVKKNLDTLAKDLDKGKTDSGATKDRALEAEPISEALAQTKSEISERLKLKQSHLDALTAVYSADIVTFFMFDSLAAKIVWANKLFEGMSYRVFSAQKKANVLYIQGQISFVSSPDESSTGTPTRYDIDEEIFIFSNDFDLYIVKVITPDIDSRADASVWVRSWLAGLQIPLSH